MSYPNLKTATDDEIKNFYPFGVFGFCDKCGATWPENSIFSHTCGDEVTPVIDAVARAVLTERDDT